MSARCPKTHSTELLIFVMAERGCAGARKITLTASLIAVLVIDSSWSSLFQEDFNCYIHVLKYTSIWCGGCSHHSISRSASRARTPCCSGIGSRTQLYGTAISIPPRVQQQAWGVLGCTAPAAAHRSAGLWLVQRRNKCFSCAINNGASKDVV